MRNFINRQQDNMGAKAPAFTPLTLGTEAGRSMTQVPDEGDDAHPSRMSNLSGAASMPQIPVGGTVVTQSKQLLPANPRRGYLYIQNNSTDDLLVSYGSEATPLSSIIITAGGYYEPRVCPTNAVYIASTSLSNAAYAYVEGGR